MERTPVWAGAKAAALPAKRAKRASFILSIIDRIEGILVECNLEVDRPSPVPGLREVAVRRVWRLFTKYCILELYLLCDFYRYLYEPHKLSLLGSSGIQVLQLLLFIFSNNILR